MTKQDGLNTLRQKRMGLRHKQRTRCALNPLDEGRKIDLIPPDKVNIDLSPKQN